MLKFSCSIIWRLGTRTHVRKYTTPGAQMYRTSQLEASKNVTDKPSKPEDDKNAGLVRAAFASLTTIDTDEPPKKPSPKSVKQNRHQIVDGQIANATDVNSLLMIAENPVVSRRHALKMVSILSEWSNGNKAKLSDFEKDPRFLKLCRILARTSTTQAMSSLTMAEDLGTVLGITGDDEAARLISNLTLPQLVKVMKALQQKGRRSTPLLHALSHSITKQGETIDLKKSADLLFSMAQLNFPDPVLLDRLCNDVMDRLPTNKDRPAVVTSIMVSLGLMKYRHEPALTALVEWVQNNMSTCRPSDIASAVVTLATVDYVPPQSEKLFEAALALKEEEMVKASMWLDLVFSLLTLNKVQKDHLISTLRPEFIEKLLSSGEIPIPSRRKLMCIDAYASARWADAAGAAGAARLAEDVSVGVPLLHTKEKALFVQAIMDTFKSLVSAETFLKKNCNSGMGFLYDAEFAVDAKCHPVPLDKAANDDRIFRIAVLGLDYHDITRKVAAPLGVNQLYTRLLELKGYKVLQIPYTEFSPKDKLVTRVQYIEKRLKDLIGAKS